MLRLLRTISVTGVFLLALAGCSGDSDKGTTKSGPETTTTTSETNTSKAATPSYTLRELQSGDAACYLQVTNSSGVEESLPGTFELCPGGSADATPYVGRRVTFERRPDRIMADSCQGNPACTETKPVELVVTVKPAGGS